MDIIAEMGPVFLGSRLRRLADRLQAGAMAILDEAGLPLQPPHMAVFACLRGGPRTIGQLTKAIGISQPAVTRSVGQLARLGLVTDRPTTDQRTRLVELTPAGASAAARVACDLWPRIGQAAEALLDGDAGPFLARLGALERALEKSSLSERAALAGPVALRLVEYEDRLAPLFHDMNVQWIEEMFTLEAADRDMLENPRDRIIDAGGVILFAEAPGLGVIGTCALLKGADGGYELAKMAVRAPARGLHAGRFLLNAAIARAISLGADPLYLLTNRRCAAAVHLYQQMGFAHDPAIMAQHGARYARCDVAMRYAGPK